MRKEAYRAAIYVRLSREDGEKEVSDSIVNQKAYIRHFLEGQADITVCAEFADDGYSGVNFERPGFQRMIQEIGTGAIDCVVVKDLSRFGRNFVETGRYLEQIFPAMGVRFIAVNDQLDTGKAKSSSDQIWIPFKNLINDAYCRDISIKIRSHLEMKRKKGEFIGSFAVYGYKKSPEDSHKLILDTYAASVVRDIFQWKLEGASQQRIADRLNERGELSPMEYKRFCGLSYQSGFQVNPQTKWTAVAVGRILRDETYIGTLVQGKRTTPNHKVKKVIQKPKEEWVRVEKHHPPLIEREDFLAVERLLLQDMRVAPQKQEVYLLSGFVFCGDCGQNMVQNSVRQKGKRYVYYMCGRNRSERICSSHRISRYLLEQAVFLSLQKQIAGTVDIERMLAFLKTLSGRQAEAEKIGRQMLRKQEEARRYQKRKEALYKAIADGVIEQEECLELEAQYNQKIQAVREAEKKQKEELEKIQKLGGEKDGIREFQQHRNILEITRYMAVCLIERIEIYEGGRIWIQFRYRDRYEGVNKNDV